MLQEYLGEVVPFVMIQALELDDVSVFAGLLAHQVHNQLQEDD